MGKNLFNLRFAVQRGDGYTSLPWRLWITAPGDVYLATKSSAGIQKYSFHRSGICRSAFTKEHAAAQSMTDRAIRKWKRTLTPQDGSGQTSHVAWLAFPTDYLSRLNLQETKKMLLIPAAPTGRAVFVGMAFTAESESSIRSALHAEEKQLVSFTAISHDEAFFIFSYSGTWENSDLKSPTVPGSIFPDLLFSEHDPTDTGRPIRICVASQPNDGDAVIIRELGGYKIQ